MKKVLSGNEAFAQGVFESGVNLVSSYPGTPSTEITENISKFDNIYVEWATNEKVALEVAIGASFAGGRSFTAMKHVGLNVAADPLMTSSYTGAYGGLVILVADDPNMYSSQNEQDSRHFARMSKLPMLEPSDSQEAKECVIKAFEISEKYECPVLLRSTTRVSHSSSIVTMKEPIVNIPKGVKKDSNKWVMTPVNARRRHVIVEQRLLDLQKVSADLAVEEIKSNKIGVVTSGVAYHYVKEAMPEVSILKLGMVWPLPIEKVSEFAKKVEKLYVVEELDKIIETELLAAGIKLDKLDRSVCGELSVEKVAELFGKKIETTSNSTFELPQRPPNMCAGCSHRGIFYAINRLKLNVTGDIGCYTLGYMPPLSAVDACVCMGASVSMAHGVDRVKSGEFAKTTVGVIGDSTFLHTGINGLINIVFNKGISTIIILDNRITGMTGHQPNPGTGQTIRGIETPPLDILQLCKAIGVKRVFKVDPFDPDACMQLLKNELEIDEVSVIITDKPCVFIDKKELKAPYSINKESCSGCRACLRLSCPAISWDVKERRASIDESQCTGCGLCPKLCRFGAIKQVMK